MGGGLEKGVLLLNEEAGAPRTIPLGQGDLALHNGIPSNYSVQQPLKGAQVNLERNLERIYLEADRFGRNMYQNQAIKLN